MKKPLLLKVHRWCGLVVCALILLQALTGSAMVFRTGLAEALDPHGMTRATTAGQAPLSAVLASVQARYPGYQIQRMMWPQDARATYFAYLVDSAGHMRFASVDPGDARVLRDGMIWRFPLELVLAIHLRLFMEKTGLAIIMLMAASLLTMVVTGVAYWWPKRGGFKKALAVKWRAPAKMLLRQLHRSTGLVVGLVATMSVVTGGLVGAEYLSEPGPLTSTSPRPGGPYGLAGVDEALAAARNLYPGRGLRDVRMPGPGVIKICFWAPQRSALAVDIVKASLPDGRVTSVAPASADNNIWVTLLPIHTGEAFGVAGQVVLFLAGLGLAALAVTGPLMWLQRTAKPQR
jgi:uncharacterized iron-regulated membrane protein